MPIDSSIYFQQQTPDFLGNFQQGVKMRDMIDQSSLQRQQINDQKAQRAAYSSAVTTGPDGKPTLDQNAYLSSLASASPKMAIEETQRLQAQQIAQQKARVEDAKEKIGMQAQLLGSVKDQDSWTAARQKAIGLGLASAQEIPEQYDPKLHQQLLGQAMTAKDQMEAADKSQHRDLEERKFAFEKSKIPNQKADETYDKVIGHLQTARGLQDVQQARKDMYSADKFASLTNLYGDPDKLNPMQVQMAASEVIKMAHGGTPTDHEMQGATPINSESQLAKAAEAFRAKPTPANQGAFINAMGDYTKSIKHDAQKVIYDSHSSVINAYKDRLSADRYDNLSKQYLEPYADGLAEQKVATLPGPKKTESKPGFFDSMFGGNKAEAATKATPAQVAPPHPQDDAAVQWATKNKNDPRAKAILKANGY